MDSMLLNLESRNSMAYVLENPIYVMPRHFKDCPSLNWIFKYAIKFHVIWCAWIFEELTIMGAIFDSAKYMSLKNT